MQKVVLIIQARMGSKRLPGKSMLDLAGKPLIFRIIERVKRCKNIDKIVLAIPNTKENKILLKIGQTSEMDGYMYGLGVAFHSTGLTYHGSRRAVVRSKNRSLHWTDLSRELHLD